MNFPITYDSIVCLSCGWIGQPFRIRTDELQRFRSRAPRNSFVNTRPQGIGGNPLFVKIYLFFFLIVLIGSLVTFYFSSVGLGISVFALLGTIITSIVWLIWKKK